MRKDADVREDEEQAAAAEKPPMTPTRSSTRTKTATRSRLMQPREAGADAHREQVDADDGRELGDRIAEQVAG